MLRRRNNIWRNIDWFTIGLYFLLVFLGWINIYAAVYNEEHYSIFDVTQRYGKQLLWIITSVFIIITVMLIDSKFYSFFANIIYALVVVLLIIVLLIGTKVHGATSWFEIGSLRIQPSEFAKFATVLALAHFVSKFNFKITHIKDLFIAAAIIFTPSLLILLQNDTGSALVYFSLLFVLYREGLSVKILIIGFLVVALFILSLIFSTLNIEIGIVIIALLSAWFWRQSIKDVFFVVLIFVSVFAIVFGVDYFFILKLPLYLQLLIAVAFFSFVMLIYGLKKRIRLMFYIMPILIGSLMFTLSVDYFFNNILEPHQQKRINTLLGLESDPLGVEYNVNQSKIAIGSGGPFGKGFLQGTQTKFNFVPEQSTDFIFCTVGEEWGFVGTSIIIVLFAVFLIRLVFLAERQHSSFSRIYGYGVVSILFFHVVINIGMTIGLVPVIGIPLPFFSYGGSSLWGFTILLFIFLKLDSSRFEQLR